MSDFFEIDFLNLDSDKSGDAIALRYRIGGVTRIHVIDGGLQDTGNSVVEHINKYYGAPRLIDAVIVTHPDGDHAGGLRAVLEAYNVAELWMLRPWLYANELLSRFTRYTNVANLVRRFRDIYPNIAALEELAKQNDTHIYEPFQGAKIGCFTVLAPTKTTYLDLLLSSEKTPEKTAYADNSRLRLASLVFEKAAAAVSFIAAAWGIEVFARDDTSAENNMSVIQYANLCGDRILLTGDAGRRALSEAADYAPLAGLALPGIDRIQVPHHGSRHNVSTEILDRWLGQRLRARPESGKETSTALISASKRDKDHPRRSVVRAFIHRGARVVTTGGEHLRTAHNAPNRDGWHAAVPLPYPDDQEAQ